MGAFLNQKRETENFSPLSLSWSKEDINLKINFKSLKAIITDKKITLVGYPSRCSGVSNLNSIDDLKGKCLLIDIWLQPFKDMQFTKLQESFIEACKQLKEDICYSGVLRISSLDAEEVLESEDKFAQFFQVWESEDSEVTIPEIETKKSSGSYGRNETESEKLISRKEFIDKMIVDRYDEEYLKNLDDDKFLEYLRLIVA